PLILFSLSSGGYVSPGSGLFSPGVGIFDPVTTTRSASASVGIPGVGEGFCAKTEQASKANNPATEAEMNCRRSSRRIEFLRIRRYPLANDATACRAVAS